MQTQSSAILLLLVSYTNAMSADALPAASGKVKAIITRDGDYHKLQFVSGDTTGIDGNAWLAALKSSNPTQMGYISVAPTSVPTVAKTASPTIPNGLISTTSYLHSLATPSTPVTDTQSYTMATAVQPTLPPGVTMPADPTAAETQAATALATAQGNESLADKSKQAAKTTAAQTSAALSTATASEKSAADAKSKATQAESDANDASIAGSAAAAAATAFAIAQLEMDPAADAAEAYFDEQDVILVAATAAAKEVLNEAIAKLTAAQIELNSSTTKNKAAQEQEEYCNEKYIDAGLETADALEDLLDLIE